MIAVILHAHPAEVISAGEADHGHTAVVFHDRRPAAGARLCVQRHPHLVDVDALSHLHPVSPHLTAYGLVCLTLTLEAEGSAAFAADKVSAKACGELDHSVAVRCATRLELLVGIRVLLGAPGAIFGQVSIVVGVLENGLKEAVRNGDVAAGLLAFSLRAHRSRLDLVLEVIAPSGG